MGKILLDDILPIIVIMILGYVLGKVHYFNDNQRQGLNSFVLDIALPAALFISIVSASRQLFVEDGVLTLISIIGVTGMFMVSYFLDRWWFHRSMAEAAVCALIAGSPTIGFLGFAVLDPIYGDNVNTNLVIGIISIVVNAITIPIGLSLVERGLAKEEDAKGEKKEESADGKKKHTGVWWSILDAVEKPVAAAPLLAVICVLIGIHFPDWIKPTFDLVAKANSGVAVLAAGLALSTVSFSFDLEVIWNTIYRLLITPAVLVLVAYWCGMGSTPTKVAMLCLATALPPAFSGIIISSRYNIYVREGASSVAVSTVGFALTSILWIWLLPILGHVL